jgi:Uma2 family endonuclease
VELGGPFDAGRGGPGGWWILDEPEIHLGPGPDRDVLVPDLAGWRVERVPWDPDDDAYLTIAPDWVCEVLSPSTALFDRAKKMPVYAREGVAHVWLLDPAARSLEVFMLGAERRWVLLGVYDDASPIRADPFGAIELDLSALWTRPST